MSETFPKALLEVLGDDPLVVVDLGARGGFDEDLLELAPGVIAIGFEPDTEEAQRLDGEPKGPWLQRRTLPYAIAGQSGPAKLHVPREPAAASLLHHNPDMIEDFGHEGLHRTLKQIPIEALTLDDVSTEAEIQEIDYLKIDIEGAELDVLKGGANLAATAKVMKIECAFVEQRIGQPLASDVISYLAANGFDLIEMRDIQHWRRRPLPSHPYSIAFDMPYSRGRVAQADLFFVRRFTEDAEGRDVAAAMLILAALGHLDLAVTLLRRSPNAQLWWRDNAIDIEKSLREISKKIGDRQLARAIKQQGRGLIPLLKSRMGRLLFNKPEREY